LSAESIRSKPFTPYMLTADGRPLIERLAESNLLPSPEEPKVVLLPGA
jgi:hypothetical protein